MHITSSEN